MLFELNYLFGICGQTLTGGGEFMMSHRKVSMIIYLLLVVFQVNAGGIRYEVYDELVRRDDIAQIFNNRPESCPLVSNVGPYGKVLVRLQESLKSFECKEAKSSLEFVKGVRSLEESSLKDWSGAETLMPVLEGSSDMLNSISEMTKNKDCLSGMKSKGFLESLADIILSTSRWGIFSERPLLMIGGGVLVSSILKVVDSIFFHKNYRWNIYSERILFDKINCAFYDIRFDLHHLGVFRSSNERTRLEEEKLEIEVQKLQERKESFRGALRDLEQKMEDERTFYNHAKVLVDELGNVKEGIAERSFFMKKLLFLSLRAESILKVFPNVTWQDSMDAKVLENIRRGLERFSMKRYLHNASMINRPSSYYNDLLFSVNSIYSFLYNYIIFYEQRQSISGFLSAPQKEIEDISKAIRVKKFLRSSLALRNSQVQYDLDDPGMIEVVGLYQYYDEMGKIIYGGPGRTFLNFLKKELLSSIKIFEAKYKKFTKTKHLNAPSSLGVFDLNSVCSRANSLVKIWSESSAWSQYIFDFIVTNIDLFQSHAGKKFRTASYSALYAKALIDKHQQKKFAIRDSGSASDMGTWEEAPFKMRRHGRSVGELMIRVYESSEKVEKLEDFIQESCQGVNWAFNN